MIACVHQPNYLPWLGFVAKIAQSDIYVVMDNVQFPKNCLTNRVRIAGNGEPLWLTVPVHRNGLEKRISDVQIDYSRDWVKKQLKTLEQHYGRCTHFKNLHQELAAILAARPNLLVDLNLPLIRWILGVCKISTKMLLGSELGVSGKASGLIAEICQRVGATTYLAGQGSADYEDLNIYRDVGIEYRRQCFQHPHYPQCGRQTFISGMSIVDALFNVGPEEARRLLLSSARANIAPIDQQVGIN